MTDAPPPQMPPPNMPPPQPPPKEPGFLVCGLMVFGGLIALSFVAGTLASLAGAAASASSGAVFLAGIVVAIYFSVRDPRFRRCFLRGLAVTAAAVAVLAGVCFAMLSSMYN